MKNIDLLTQSLERTLKNVGEDAPFVTVLRRQIAVLEYGEEKGFETAMKSPHSAGYRHSQC